MKKSNFKQIFLTLALLITAATGAWADGEKYTVQFKANGNTKTVENVTLPHTFSCSYNNANDELDQILKELYGWPGSVEETSCYSEAPSSDDTSKATTGKNGDDQYITISNAFEGTLTVAGKYWVQYNITPYSLEISFPGYAPLMTLDETNTVATMEMPASDVTVEYSLVRDLTQQVTFGGIPTGDGLVVKNNGTAYEFVTAPTFTLIDGLADNADITEGITITTQKKGEGDTWQTLDASALAAGYAPGTYRLVATANADGPYDGTIYSAAFTTVEKYDLLIQPADEYSKGKLSEVTVAGTAQTLDADGKATVTTESGKEVKFKAKRGYVIEKVEAKKTVRLTYPIALSEVTADYLGSVVGADGNIYDSKDAASTAGTTAVAMIAYVGNASDCTNGLAIALADESGTMTWSGAGPACSGKTSVTGGTWRLPSVKDWQYMFIGCGSGESYSEPSGGMTRSYSGLASKLSTAGGTALQLTYYWSSTESSPSTLAWYLDLDGSNASFNYSSKNVDDLVRAVLAF